MAKEFPPYSDLKTIQFDLRKMSLAPNDLLLIRLAAHYKTEILPGFIENTDRILKKHRVENPFLVVGPDFEVAKATEDELIEAMEKLGWKVDREGKTALK